MRELFDDPEDIAIRTLTISSDGTKLVAGTSAGICYIRNADDS